ncbi:MAG: hypothetical protein V2A76_17295 [Planctomycetota bacterium]
MLTKPRPGRTARVLQAFLPLLLLLLPSLESCGTPPKGPPRGPPLATLESLLEEQTSLYPLITEEDLYKLIYQATMGPGHMFMGRDSKLDIGLYEEMGKLDPSPAAEEPLFEILDPSNNLARVNLRPYLRGGGKASDLARAVARTAHEFRGDKDLFLVTLKAAGQMLDQLAVSFDREDLADHVIKMKEAGFPSGVHSERYALTYDPAYRLVYLHYLTDRDYGGRFLDPEEED